MKDTRKTKQLRILTAIAVILIAALVGMILWTGKRNQEMQEAPSSAAAESSRTGSEQDRMDADFREEETEEEQKLDANPGTASRTSSASNLARSASLSPETIHSLYGYMVRIGDGSVILDKESQSRIYPASMTKIMTALVTIETLPDLEEKLTVTQEILDPLNQEGASLAGFTAGETPTVRELLYGVLLPSGGEACEVLANRAAGSVDAFVELMNKKAAELGLQNTHFTNVTGLHDEQHYTTCRDMAKLLETALKNPVFYQIITAREYTCAPDTGHPEGLHMESTMFKNLEKDVLDNGAQILGGKTGTTDEAGYCLASFAVYQGQTYILVTAMGQYNDEGTHINMEDALSAYGAL